MLKEFDILGNTLLLGGELEENIDSTLLCQCSHLILSQQVNKCTS